MKKTTLLLLFFTIITLHAHTFLMEVINNKNNTITVIGKFDNGDIAAGALVKLESLISGNILLKQRLTQTSSITIKIPKEPYQIVLDGGPEGVIIQKGVEPLEGFNQRIIEKNVDITDKLSQPKNVDEMWSIPTTILFIIGLLLIILTLFIGVKNTNKIIQKIEQR